METTKILHPSDIELEDICARTRRKDEERLQRLAEAQRELEKREPDFKACAMLAPYRERLVELARGHGCLSPELDTSLALGRFIAEKLQQPKAEELLPSDIVTLLNSR